MKKIYMVTLLCLLAIGMYAQVNINTPWTWAGGDKHIPLRQVPGVKGVTAPGNMPSGRKDPVNWVDATGTTWMFGGAGHGLNGSGVLNDLWKYDNATNQWTWMSGSMTVNNTGVYGSQGIADDANMPGGRTGSSSWVGSDGKLYLFGGNGWGDSGSGWLNDLWRYDPLTNQWTWVNGPAAVNVMGIYGTEGVAAMGNRPGSRSGAVVWKGSENTIWLFGGDGFATSGTIGRLSDLWRYDQGTNQWTWMRGDNITNAAGGSSNGPVARNAGNTAWKDNAGNLYLFGGVKNSSSGIYNPPCGDGCPYYTLLGDFWKYTVSTNSWTQLSSGTMPRARFHGLSWTDASGMFWLFGGYGFNAHSAANPNITVEAHLNDLWKYNPNNQQWTKLSGDYGEQIPGVYGVMGVTAPTNKKGGRASGVTWFDAAGKLYSFGGQVQEGSPVTFRNDVWSYNPATSMYTWLKGDSLSSADPSYGQMGVESPSNHPGERAGSGEWSDNNGNLWLFGGDKHKFNSSPPGYYAFDDLWRYNITSGQWAWLQPTVGSRPGSRQNMNTWTDNAGNLWLFGGQGYYDARFNDLWKYTPASNTWTLMKGSASTFPSNSNGGVYGVQGVADPANTPAARELSVNWKDNAGNLWLFGGKFNNGFGGGQYDDLWKFDIASGMWAWMKGTSSYNQTTSTIIQLGVPDVNNFPGARIASGSWTDNAGNLWMFGGEFTGSPMYSGDLWKYNPLTSEWTCFAQTTNTAGVYGVKGTAAAGNKPGTRGRFTTWTDAFGNLWLMGGYGFDKNGAVGHLNDVWMYSVSTNQWTWVKGDDVIAATGVYGTKGIPNAANKPGGRYAALSWLDGAGDIWLYGGVGFDEGGFGPLPDMWKLASPALAPLPVHLLEFKGRLVNNDGLLNWKTENEENTSSYIVERSIDRRNYVPVGTVIAGNTNGMHQYSFTDPGIASLGASVIYYRLKQKDLDGKTTYSNIIALTIDKSLLVMVYPNPAIKTLNVTITTDRAETVNVRVMNATGAVMKKLQWKLTSGSRSESIDVSVLASGAYYLELSGETMLKRISFVKQ